MGDQRLPARAGLVAAVERLAGRPGRSAAHLPRLLRRLHPVFGAERIRRFDSDPDPVPIAARHRRRTARADDANDDGPSRGTPHGTSHRRGRDAGHGRPNVRPQSRRRDPWSTGLAMDLLRQRSGWPGGDLFRMVRIAARRNHQFPPPRSCRIRDDLARPRAAAARPGLLGARRGHRAAEPGGQRVAFGRLHLARAAPSRFRIDRPETVPGLASSAPRPRRSSCQMPSISAASCCCRSGSCKCARPRRPRPD